MRLLKSIWSVMAILLVVLLVVPATTPLAATEDTVASSPSTTSSVFYEPPPGVMPIVYLSGTEYEMGYQYGQQAGAYIEIVKDGLWASLLARYDKAEILDKLTGYEAYVKKLAGVDYVAILKGIADGARDAGYDVSYEDVLTINYQVELEWLPHPKSSCTNMAMWGGATADGQTIAGSHFDFPWSNAYTYRVIIVAYPAKGNAFISTAIAGMLGNNFLMNDKGLVYMSNKSANARPEDIDYGVSDFILGPYVAMTCSTAEEAKETILSVKSTNGINRLLVDKNGGAYAVEATAALAAVRAPGDFGEKDYLIAANHFVNPEMKETQKPWEAIKYYPASWYRYQTAAKYIEDNYGKMDVDAVMSLLTSSKYWNGTEWHYNAWWTGNTINRFSAWGGTVASQIAVPGEGTVYICTGNPGTSYWSVGAPGQTGQYVKLQLKNSPSATANTVKKAAFSEFLSLAKLLTSLNLEKRLSIASILAVDEQLDLVRDQYWKGVRYLVKASLTEDKNSTLKLYSEASTEFAKVQAGAKRLSSLLSRYRSPVR